MSTMSDVDRERQANQHANALRVTPAEVWVKALERARWGIAHGDLKLADREIEYVVERLERLIP